MKAYITFPGDPSVGIFGWTYEIETPIFDKNEKENRNGFLKDLVALYENWDDWKASGAWFSDECGDCRTIKKPNESCSNKNCVSHY